MKSTGNNDIFLKEYSSNQAVLKYSRETAGRGIAYLLEHDYANIYLDVLNKNLTESAKRHGIRMLEFGCGAGMNILHLVTLLDRTRIPLKQALGSDFSRKLIDAANREAERSLPEEKRRRLQFLLARNEALLEDLALGLEVEQSSISGSFDLIFGVNTSRYCHRMKKELEYARGIFHLLDKGGICVVIDMNQKFPLFRSRFHDKLTMEKEDYYLPSLAEYARPFEAAGFEILRMETFSWVPHSAGALLTQACRAMTPALNWLFPNSAMRCLVVARKPA